MSILDKATVFAEGLDHPECIAYHPDGSVWAGGEAGQIYRISADGLKMKEVASTGGFILGIAFSPDCSWLLICDLGNKCLIRLNTQSYELSEFSKGADGHNFNIPNYACFDKKGDVYVSESGVFREVNGKILKYDTDGNGHVWCDGPINFANGMCLDAEETYLYVVCSFMPGIERIRINGDGSAGDREVFVTIPESVPDGVAFDADGNLYISCYAPNKIYRVAPDKTISVLVDDWEAHTLSNPTNIAFGGSDFDQLFTANLGRWHVTKIDLGIKGLKLVCHL
ncbi:MAG: SMP-30/gluconolactonase/LRE family protein [Cyclobacteriaceae bacterium]